MQNQICLSDSGSDDEVLVDVVPKRQRKEPIWNSDDISCCEEDEIQIKDDEEIALALQNELDKEETSCVHRRISGDFSIGKKSDF